MEWRWIPILVLALHAGVCAGSDDATNRPAAWAQPVTLGGVPNLHRVAAGLYRSAQPTAEGMRRLQALGIRTVVDLRSFHSDRAVIGGAGLAYECIPTKAWHPEREAAVRFLQIVTDPARGPFLVHCQHGADRTGALCALYRMAVQGWTREEALREMVYGGFGFHEVWENLLAWAAAMDIVALRRDAGITNAVDRAAELTGAAAGKEDAP